MADAPISWDKYALQVNGKKTFLISGEFHYWRVPDRARWQDILKAYKIAGLNALRIYFHWGYHSPDDGVYHFDGNRDVEYLLKLCEELDLKVFVAAGPYICAETSAGGYPLWLVSKRDVRIKHMRHTGLQKYDPKYMQYCRQWWENFIPKMAGHQLTQNPAGCIIAFQVENEYMEKLVVIKGSRRYMKELQQYARELGVTVPTFHDDGMLAGSWNGLVDLYGFNKYPIWAPKFPKQLPLRPWSIDQFVKTTAGLGAKVRSFGPPASETPIFVPELQGGWFNHWTIRYGYDELYDFYGSPYQKMLVETFAAEGATAMSLYMFYGGTSYGAIGDPEVYTSYDYSACLREYGYQSDRLRFLRQFALFAQSFGESFSSTDVIPPPAKGDENLTPLKCNVPGIFYCHRRSVIDGTDYFFLRNFSKTGAEKFHVVLPGSIRVPKEGLLALSPRESFIAVGNCPLGQYTIKFSSIPVITKGSYAGGTMLVLTHNDGELLLQGTGYTVSGDAQATAEDLYTRIFFPTPGYAVVKSPQEDVLYLICLSHADALTLNVDFSKPDLRVAWGAYSVFFNPAGQLELETMGQQEVWLALPDLVVEDFSPVTDVPVPGLQRGLFGSDISVPDTPFSTWERHATDSANDPDVWKEIDFAKERDAVDHRYLSGHILYKCEFTAAPGPKLRLKLTIRHKAGVWLNGQFIGGHATYGIGILSQGAMQGPDRGGDAKTYDLSPAIKWGESNVLFVLVEMLGQNKQPYVINDARAPRGILQAKFSTQTKDTKWFIAGIDVSTLDDPYNTAGLPGEKHNFHIGQGDGWEPCAEPIHITPNDQIAWFKTQFVWHAEDNTRIPLRLHVDGLANASIFLNGQFIARYWGEAGPQHDFYLLDGFLQDGVNDLVLACWTTQETNIGLSVLPYKVKLDSGNIDDEAGTTFATCKSTISL